MIFHETKLHGVRMIEMKQLRDERGFFARSFCEREFAEQGLISHFAQQNTSQSVQKGTVRGLHYQRAPHAEAKVMRCIKGAIFHVIADLRPESPTYKQWQGFELTEDNRLQIYVPEGFANGYQALTDYAEACYFASAPYAPGAEGGLRYDDPGIGIELPLPVSSISDKDRAWPDFVG